mgnify:CR=1 FL=1
MREQADLDPRDFESREAADKSVYVKFYTKPVQDEAESVKEGRPIYKEREYVEIRTPGQQNNVIQRPVTDMDRQRFRLAYRQFKEGIEDQLVGTPLTEVGWMTRSQVEELHHMRVRTVEHLAELNDSVCGAHAGLYKLKQKAQQVIEEGKKNAPFAVLQEQHERAMAEMEALRQTVAEQSEIIKGLQSAKSAK